MIKRWIRRWLGIDSPPPESARAEAVKRAKLKINDLALAALAKPRSSEPMRVKLTLPELPPGVRPTGDSMAMDDAGEFAPIMDWANSMGGIGCGLYFPGYPYLAELAQRPEYRSPVETIAEEMTRKWIKFQSVGGGDLDQRVQELEAAFKEFGIQDVFRKATEKDGYFGRAQVYIDVKGQENERDKPLVIETIPIGGLRGFKVIEPMWTTPVAWNATDPTRDDFYKPTVWSVLGRTTHDSRLIMFISREVPDLLKPSYNFGGISLSQLLESYVKQWLRTRDDVADLIHNFSIIVLATNMEATLAGEDGEEERKRGELFIRDRDNRGLMKIDKETEDLKVVATSLAGLDELQAQAQEHMCAVTRVPLVKAFGISPSGLNATSEFEIMVFYDHIAARQEIVYTPNLRTVSHAVQCHLWGKVDDRIEAMFEPLKELDGESLGRVRKGDAELAATLIQNGVITPEEERERIAADPNSGYNNLDPSAVPDPDDIPGQQQQQGEGGEGGDDE